MSSIGAELSPVGEKEARKVKRAKVINIAHLAAILAVALCATFFLGAAQAASQEEVKPGKHRKTVQLIPSLEGADLFSSYCANCHGPTGKGDGPIASFLDKQVSDLSTIPKRNGGTFPSARVRAVIAGDELIKAHGTREMPMWGPIFHQVEKGRDLGNIRLENVTKYVESLQEK